METVTAAESSTSRKLACELVGTFILVFGGTGSAVLAATYPELGIGFVGVSLAFGLTVLGCAYGLGQVSGGHFNPAVTFGLCTAGRFAWRSLPGYLIAQVLGAIAASAAVLAIAKGAPGGYDAATQGLAANGYGAHSPGHYALGVCLFTEIVLTFIFVAVILGSTSKRAVAGFAGIPIGLTLTLVHLVGIPVTNVSVNPARSTGPALLVGDWAMAQLWLFWLAPLVGAGIAGVFGAWVHEDRAVVKPVRDRAAPTPTPRPTSPGHAAA
jgi:aquaporin Z